MSGAEQKSTSRSLAGPRCIAIVGPFQSGKTTLLEAILERTGALQRAGRVTDGNAVGDSSAEARAHCHGVEPNVATPPSSTTADLHRLSRIRRIHARDAGR